MVDKPGISTESFVKDNQAPGGDPPLFKNVWPIAKVLIGQQHHISILKGFGVSTLSEETIAKIGAFRAEVNVRQVRKPALYHGLELGMVLAVTNRVLFQIGVSDNVQRTLQLLLNFGHEIPTAKNDKDTVMLFEGFGFDVL